MFFVNVTLLELHNTRFGRQITSKQSTTFSQQETTPVGNDSPDTGCCQGQHNTPVKTYQRMQENESGLFRSSLE